MRVLYVEGIRVESWVSEVEWVYFRGLTIVRCMDGDYGIDGVIGYFGGDYGYVGGSTVGEKVVYEQRIELKVGGEWKEVGEVLGVESRVAVRVADVGYWLCGESVKGLELEGEYTFEDLVAYKDGLEFNERYDTVVKVQTEEGLKALLEYDIGSPVIEVDISGVSELVPSYLVVFLGAYGVKGFDSEKVREGEWKGRILGGLATGVSVGGNWLYCKGGKLEDRNGNAL